MSKLLLISHDDVLARAYTVRLKRAGFEVEHRTTGREGLAWARQWNPEVIVLELVLPGMHGLDVLKLLRDVPWLAKVPVVVLIEHTMRRDVLEECRMWGAASFLEKDVQSLDEIIEHLQTAALPSNPPS